jgi:hypothetical protein
MQTDQPELFSRTYLQAGAKPLPEEMVENKVEINR